MGQILVRQLISTSTGLPLTEKTVTARPIWATSAAHDQPMPETPALSGYYVSTTEVPHDTYRIYADNVDTGEMVTVRPGLLIVGAQGDEDSYAPRSIDRILNNKATLSMFVADTSSTPTNDNFTAAVNFASSLGKTLVLDYDFAPTTDLAISGNLSLDLNGHTLDFQTNGVALTANVLSVKGLGTVKLKAGGKSLIGTSKLTVSHVTFSGDFESQATAVATDSYVACKGVTGFKFSRTSDSYDYTVPRISGCDGGFDVGTLVLADYDTDATGTASGDERRIDLQQTIDEELVRLHYLIGKKSSATPYSDGYFSDTTLTSISSLCSVQPLLVSMVSYAQNGTQFSDPISLPTVSKSSTGSLLSSTYTATKKGWYRLSGYLKGGASSTSGTGTGFISFPYGGNVNFLVNGAISDFLKEQRWLNYPYSGITVLQTRFSFCLNWLVKLSIGDVIDLNLSEIYFGDNSTTQNLSTTTFDAVTLKLEFLGEGA